MSENLDIVYAPLSDDTASDAVVSVAAPPSVPVVVLPS